MIENLLGRAYRNLFILDSRLWWEGCKDQYDPDQDVVLTYDLALNRQLVALGGSVYYLDHLVDKDSMQANNFSTANYLKNWHLDENGSDLFTHDNVEFGFSFRIEIWNDILSYVRERACLGTISKLQYDKLFVGAIQGNVHSILSLMNVEFETVTVPINPKEQTYYFPIYQWMDEKVRSKKLKQKLLYHYIALQGTFALYFDKLFTRKSSKKNVFIQVYFPTLSILKTLKSHKTISLILGYFTPSRSIADYFIERPIPIYGSTKKYGKVAEDLMNEFRLNRCATLRLSDGVEISEAINSIVDTRISERLPTYLRDLGCIVRYLDARPIDLEIMIANIGRVDTLVDCVCKSRGVPSYLIINGLMGPDFGDEGKYAKWINGYSESIKANYFKGMENIVCLGDPRMDSYHEVMKTRIVNRQTPTITVGASGFNIVDLNSYLAIEFEFLWDVLRSLTEVTLQGITPKIIIKVRSNGYKAQYTDFIHEYFPDLDVEIQDVAPMIDVLKKTDFYISIYSQTLFEASCLGIPCVYYKKDNEIIPPPFDGKSELVTIDTIADLTQAVIDFCSEHERYLPFLDRAVMEKYIGPLDGKNLDRNLHHIYDLLGLRSEDIL